VINASNRQTVRDRSIAFFVIYFRAGNKLKARARSRIHRANIAQSKKQDGRLNARPV
jgi:hypothetical protein